MQEDLGVRSYFQRSCKDLIKARSPAGCKEQEQHYRQREGKGGKGWDEKGQPPPCSFNSLRPVPVPLVCRRSGFAPGERAESQSCHVLDSTPRPCPGSAVAPLGLSSRLRAASFCFLIFFASSASEPTRLLLVDLWKGRQGKGPQYDGWRLYMRCPDEAG